jgi:AraC-like DNA-binding protein
MVFEFTPSPNMGFMAGFANAIGTAIVDDTIEFPENLGSGYIKMLDLGMMFKLLVFKCRLKEEVVFRRIASKERKGVLTMAFHNTIREKAKQDDRSKAFSSNVLPYVQMTSTDLDFDTVFPADTDITTVFIAIHTDIIKNMLNLKQEHEFFNVIISSRQTYLYEEIISPQMQEVFLQIIQGKPQSELHDFYFRLRAEELIYLLFSEMLKRNDAPNYSINSGDAKRMYQLRDTIIEQLSVPPNLTELAKLSGMSESKMQRLFKQIFGNSIYNYYQSIRMNEAAYLLKNESYTVSEVGYSLGFSNLSHFTRLFERYFGVKPKKFSLSK